MGKSRPRFNEKARASSKRANQRPHPRARDGGLGPQAFDPSTAPQETTSNDRCVISVDLDRLGSLNLLFL